MQIDTIEKKCLVLTGSFETSRKPPDCFSALVGNFDGQGMSFGFLQWNFGQGTLTRLLQVVNQRSPDVMRRVFGDNYPTLIDVLSKEKSAVMQFASSIGIPAKPRGIIEPWRSMFAQLGNEEACQSVQVEMSVPYFNRARGYVDQYRFWSERAYALMFDICVQSGSISAKRRILLEQRFASVDKGLSEEAFELNRLRLVAEVMAVGMVEKSKSDVLARKLCIATGSGSVHGIEFDLKRDFDIGLVKVAVPSPEGIA